MEPGFGVNLEGSILRGNLTLEANQSPLTGDGSLEISGTLYGDTILPFNNQSQGLLVNQVLFQDGYVFIPFVNPSTGFTSGSLLSAGGITIQNTTNVSGMSSGGGLTNFGGTCLLKDVCIGGETDVTLNKIVNLNDPAFDFDAVNLRTLRSYAYSNTLGNITQNYTQGQVIVADYGTTGALIGYNEFKYTVGTLVLTNTSGNVSISVNNKIDMNMTKIINLQDPTDPYDAVNLRTLDSYFLDCDLPPNGENTLLIQYTLTPTPIPILTYDATQYLAFETYLYLNDYFGSKALYCFRGVYDSINSVWTMNTVFYGNGSPNPIINFIILTIGTVGVINYTSSSLTPAYAKYRNLYKIDNLGALFNSVSLSPALITTNTGITLKTGVTRCFRSILRVTSATRVNLIIISGLYEAVSGVWRSQISLLGYPQDIQFSMDSFGSLNYMSSISFTLETLETDNSVVEIKSTDTIFPLALTLVPLTTTETYEASQQQNFILSAYVYGNSKSAFYSIYGVYNTDTWDIVYNYIGDDLGVSFSVTTSNSGEGTLNYTCSVTGNSMILYNTYLPELSRHPLCVIKGGTGTASLLPYALLIGNGLDPVYTLDKLIYYNNTLITTQLEIVGTSILHGILDKDNTRIINLADPINDNDALNKGFVYTGGLLDAHNQRLINVATPTNGTDAVNKDYLQDLLDNTYPIPLPVTIGGIGVTQLLPYSVVLGNSTGPVLTSNTLTYYNNKLVTDNIHVSSGSTLSGILDKSNTRIINLAAPTNDNDALNKGYVYTGGLLDGHSQRVINVDDPVQDYDAINKLYLDKLLHDCSFSGTPYDDLFETPVNLPQTLIPTVVPLDFLDDPNLLGFLVLAYIRDYNVFDLHTGLYLLRGIKTTSGWVLNVTHSGTIFNHINFSVNTSGQLKYTNDDNFSSVYARFRSYTTFNLASPVTSITTTVPQLLYKTAPSNLGYQLYILLTDAIVILTTLNKGGVWYLYTTTIGNTPGLAFDINATNGNILYTSSVPTFDSRVNTLWTLNTPITTLTPTVVPIPLTLLDLDTKSNFYVVMYVKVSNVYTIYEIYGKKNTNGDLIINITQKGDLDTDFYVVVSNNLISYTLSGIFNAEIAYYINTPPDYPNPLCVVKGGTGHNELPTTLVLLGNGQDPIDSNPNLGYTNDTLKIGTSSYTFFNTSLQNAVNTPIDLYNLNFAKAIDLSIAVTILTTSSVYDTLYCIKGISTASNWVIQTVTLGNTSMVSFDINPMDQLAYISDNVPGWLSTTMKSRFMAIV
jgi:hypothetical protein